MYGITYSSSVHLITFDMEAILAPPKTFFIRKRCTSKENVHIRIIAPYSYQLFANTRVLYTSRKVNKFMPV